MANRRAGTDNGLRIFHSSVVTFSMNLLAFDTSTDVLSIAVQRGNNVWQYQGAGGAQASASLIPTVRDLMAQAEVSFDALNAIVFGRGPGSFTGLRTACAVAQGFAFGACGGSGVRVLPVDTLLAVAEEARSQHGCTQVVAVIDARMDEVYHAQYEWSKTDGYWHTDSDFGLCKPEAVQPPNGWTVAGNAKLPYGERLAPRSHHVLALPTANALLRLAPALIAGGAAVSASGALPRYVRDKVAQTTAERTALRAAAALQETTSH